MYALVVSNCLIQRFQLRFYWKWCTILDSVIVEFPQSSGGQQLISAIRTPSELANPTEKSKLSIKHLVRWFSWIANSRWHCSYSTESHQFQFPGSCWSNSWSSYKGKERRCVSLCHEIWVWFSSDSLQRNVFVPFSKLTEETEIRNDMDSIGESQIRYSAHRS